MGKTVRNDAAISFFENYECITKDHNYSGDCIVDNFNAEVPSESHETSDSTLFCNEKENESTTINVPIEELPESQSKPAAGIATQKNTSHSRSILGPVRTRAKRTTYMRRSGMEYLKKKHEKEMELEERRLALEEKKVAISERTIALQERKFLFESENFKLLFDSQQRIINDLLGIVKYLKSKSA